MGKALVVILARNLVGVHGFKGAVTSFEPLLTLHTPMDFFDIMFINLTISNSSRKTYPEHLIWRVFGPKDKRQLRVYGGSTLITFVQTWWVADPPLYRLWRYILGINDSPDFWSSISTKVHTYSHVVETSQRFYTHSVPGWTRTHMHMLTHHGRDVRAQPPFYLVRYVIRSTKGEFQCVHPD